jgi:hypothetical protein
LQKECHPSGAEGSAVLLRSQLRQSTAAVRLRRATKRHS